MSSQFHNRLVGTVVLVALGVIFLPDILDGKKERQEEQFAEIPLRPTLTEQQQSSDGMFEVLSVQDTGASTGEQHGLVEPSPNDEAALAQAVKSNPPKAEAAKPNLVKEPSKQQTAKAESKPESTKPAPQKNIAKTEPAKKTEAKPTITAKVEKPKADVAKSEKPKVGAVTPPKDEVKTVSREPITSGFTLQLGAFANATNVKVLVAQLRKNGFKVYTTPVTPKDGVLTKVFVGPDASEAKLKKMQEDIESLTRLKGRIVPFNPVGS